MYQTSMSKGQELIAQRMVRDFIALGHKAYLITSVFHDGVEVMPSNSLTKSKGYVLIEDDALGIPVIRVDSEKVKWPHRRINFRDGVEVLEKIVDEFNLNVLITHSTLWNGPEEVAKFIAWRRYMRRLGGYQDSIVFCHMSHFQDPSGKRYSFSERTFRMAWNRFSLSQILKTADLVLVVTPMEAETMVKIGCDHTKCVLFPGGVDEKTFLQFASADTSDFRRKHRIPETKKLVTYLGTLEERKNPLGVLKVAELLQDRIDIHFVIAGKGDDEYTREMQEKASQLSNVTFLGEIDSKSKIQLIRSSYLNIIMSRLEALGLSQLEFMYASVPVITSGVSGQAWLVQDGKEGIHTCGPNDATGAANAIITLADDYNLRSRLGQNAHEKARNLTSSQIIRRLDDAITMDLIVQNGLAILPSEARETLAEPEHVLKTWSAGTWAVTATDRRLFIREGRISRRIAEIPYASIAYVEHARRYSWKFLLAGLLPAFVLLFVPLWRVILSETFISTLAVIFSLLTQPLLAFASPQTLVIFMVLAAMIAGFGAFLLEARVGFNLYVLGIKPVYIPRRLSEVITFLRHHQDQSTNLQLEDIELLT